MEEKIGQKKSVVWIKGSLLVPLSFVFVLFFCFVFVCLFFFGGVSNFIVLNKQIKVLIPNYIEIDSWPDVFQQLVCPRLCNKNLYCTFVPFQFLVNGRQGVSLV